MKKSAATRLIALVVMLLFAFTACSPSAESETSLPAEESSSSTAENSQTDTGEDYSKLSAEVANAVPPTFSGATEPAKAPENIKVALVPSDAALSGTAVPAAGIEEAAKALDRGWQVQWYNGKGTPADQNKAILDAISWGADIIVCLSCDARSVQQGLKAAQDAGIPVVSASNGTDDPNTPDPLEEGQIDFIYDVAVDYHLLGSSIAKWIVGDAGNQGSVAVFGDKEFPSCMMAEYGLLDEFAKYDMDISEVMYFTGGQVGDTLNRQVIGYLMSNPETKYVFIPYDPAAIGVCEAITTAGLTDVKVCSVLGTEQMQELIRSDTCAAASVAIDLTYMGWACMDQFIRLLNDQPLYTPHGENVPLCVMDETNVSGEGGDWTAPYSYKESFLALWE